jgi:hypothetical protein
MKTFLFKLYNNVLVVKSRECHFKKLEDSGWTFCGLAKL